jgi:hypothetical protein
MKFPNNWESVESSVQEISVERFGTGSSEKSKEWEYNGVQQS